MATKELQFGRRIAAAETKVLAGPGKGCEVLQFGRRIAAAETLSLPMGLFVKV